MKDLSEAKTNPGVELIKDRKNGVLVLTQHKYIKKVLERFKMGKSKPV